MQAPQQRRRTPARPDAGQCHHQLLQAVHKVAPAGGKGGADAGEKALVRRGVGLHLVQVDIHGALLHLVAVPVQLALPALDLGLHFGKGVLDLQQVGKIFGLCLQLL
jgi:hypothetical protein